MLDLVFGVSKVTTKFQPENVFGHRSDPTKWIQSVMLYPCIVVDTTTNVSTFVTFN